MIRSVSSSRGDELDQVSAQQMEDRDLRAHTIRQTSEPVKFLLTGSIPERKLDMYVVDENVWMKRQSRVFVETVRGLPEGNNASARQRT